VGCWWIIGIVLFGVVLSLGGEGSFLGIQNVFCELNLAFGIFFFQTSS